MNYSAGTKTALLKDYYSRGFRIPNPITYICVFIAISKDVVTVRISQTTNSAHGNESMLSPYMLPNPFPRMKDLEFHIKAERFSE